MASDRGTTSNFKSQEARAAVLFRQFLRVAGYSDESVVREFVVSRDRRRYVIDFAVVDTDTGNPLMLFEVKVGGDESVKRAAVSYFRSVRKALEPRQVQTYLARVDPDKSQVQVFSVMDDELTLVNTDLPSVHEAVRSDSDTIGGLPSLHQAAIVNRTGTVIASGNKLRSETGVVRRTSWLLAFAVATCLTLDVLGVFHFTAQQLSLFAAFIVLVLIPFSARLKLLGLEYESLSSQRVDSTQAADDPRRPSS